MKKHSEECKIKKTSIGGQALMEGIMMRGPEKTAIAVRNPKGDIILENWDNPAVKRPKICRLPIIRGVFGFVDSMITGYRCLMHSAEITALEDVVRNDTENQGEIKKFSKDSRLEILPGNGPVPGYTLADLKEELNDSEKSKSKGEQSEKSESPEDDKIGKGTWNFMMVVGVLFALVLCVGLFLVLPSFLYVLFSGAMLKIDPSNVLFRPDISVVEKWSWLAVSHLFGETFVPVDSVWLSGGTLALRSFLKSLFEGVLRVLILVGYMALVSRMKEIKRTFMYHGAEHKTIFCYEKGLELNVENVRLQKRFHPRCGTSFLILMVLVSIFVSFFIDPLCVFLVGSVPAVGIRAIIKICLIPLIMGLGYELLKFAGRHDNWLTRMISAPGVALQHITVYEPTDDMIECAIAAVKKVIPNDGSDRW